MNIIANITLNALVEQGLDSLLNYRKELERACDLYEPAFGKKWYLDKYQELCSDAAWFINSLVSNAAKEGEGSRRLWEMASRTPDVDIAEKLRQHALDEARHGRFYMGMIKFAFPSEQLNKKIENKLNPLIPRYSLDEFPEEKEKSSEKVILDELIQINIGEIRTRMHQLMLQPVLLHYAPEENKEKINNIIQNIILDETRHISYTAHLIEAAICNGQGDFVRKVMDIRWEEFNDITYAEMEGKKLYSMA